MENQRYQLLYATKSSLTRYTQEKEDVELVVRKCFPDLVWFDMLVFDTRLVFLHSLDGNSALPLGEKRRSNGRVRQQDEHDNSPSRTKRATDEDRLALW